MLTSSNGNIFRVAGHLCGAFIGYQWIPAQRPVTRNFDVFFHLCLNKQLSKQWWGWWFEKLRCHCTQYDITVMIYCEIVPRSLDLTDDKSTLVQIMAWCCQATLHWKQYIHDINTNNNYRKYFITWWLAPFFRFILKLQWATDNSPNVVRSAEITFNWPLCIENPLLTIKW